MRRILLAWICVGLGGAACRDGGGGPGPGPGLDAGVPASLAFESGGHRLEILSEPLGLRLWRGDEALTGAEGDALALGRVGVVPGAYVDPEAPPGHLEWTRPRRVVAVDGERLALDDGSTLRVTTPADGVFRLELGAPGADPPQLVRVSLGVTPTERFFGFGELWDRVSSRGAVRPMQFRVDGSLDTGLNELHAPVPLAISPRGWALLVESRRPGAFDVAATREDRIAATFQVAPEEPFVFDVMGDPDPLALLERYAALTARPALPPYWALGPMQWRNQVAGSDEVLADARAMRRHGVPATVLWIDNPWQAAYNDFRFAENFPDPEGLVADLRALGYRVLVWSTPYLDRAAGDDWERARAAGFFVRLGDGLYPPLTGFGNAIDFTAPGATEFWRGLVDRVVSIGVSGFKLDYGEDFVADLIGRVPDWRVASGEDPATLWKTYVRLYHQAYLGALPEGDGVLITRSGALGEQDVNPILWPCDLDSDFGFQVAGGAVGGLPAAISAGLSLSASGYPFFGSDIGGFRGGRPPKEVLVRWAEYAALGTIMQLGGGGESHNPWDFDFYDAETLEVYRRYARLHTDLFPYLWTLALRAHETGRPVTVPLGLAFPDDEEAWAEDFEYLLGDAFLVAPIYQGGAAREVYLPEGEWVDFFTREQRPGPARFREEMPLDRIGLWWRRGAIVPLLRTPVDTLAEASVAAVVSYRDHLEELRVVVIPDEAPSSFTVFDGTRIDVEPGEPLAVTVEPGAQFADFRLEVLVGGEFVVVETRGGRVAVE